MVDALVETKLLQPRPRREAVQRPRLAALLRHATDLPVTVVSAPAGFGKTTLLASWLSTTEVPTAWVSLDARDRAAASFWPYVLTALDRAVLGSGAAAALALFGSGQAAIETVLAGVVNELSVHDGDLVLVLDDYHFADGPEVTEGMTFLVEHLPPQLHLVVSTRADPGLPLPRLRARGELVEVRATDLRFDGDEVAAYLNDLNGLGLPAEAVAALETRTEGWVAALQLAVLSLRDRSDAAGFIDRFAGDDRFVVDYLVDEVLDRQPDSVRRFLLDTSVLERLTGTLCDALLDDAASNSPGAGRAMLDLLDRQNLFVVPLDDHRRWYRYHHLFGHVLRAHLLQERPGDVPELHRRASSWYAANGDVEEAVRHALTAGDLGAAADLVERAVPDLRRLRRESVIRRWVDDLPDDVLVDRPALAMGLVGGLMASNDFAGVEDRLRAVEATVTRPGSELVVVDQAEFDRIPAAIEMYRAALALVGGDPETAVARAARAIDAAPADDDLTPPAAAGISGLASWTMGDVVAAHASYVTAAAGLASAGYVADVLGCSLTIADMELTLGRLGDAEATLRGALELAERNSPVGGVLRGTADMLVALSRIAWHRDDMAAAADLVRRADDLGEAAGLPQNPYRWRVAMARVRAAERDWTGALELVDDAVRVYVGDFSPPVHPLHATRARLLAAAGDLDAAAAWAREHGLSAEDDLSYLREYEHLTFARILLAQHRTGGDENALRDARALLDRLFEAAEAGSRTGTVLEVEVLRALARHASGDDTDAALESLDHAVELAEPQGWVRFLLDSGPGVGELLVMLAGRRPHAAFVRDLIARRVDEPAARSTGSRPAVGPQPIPTTPAASEPPGRLLDPLSDRELDVLRLLASDLDGPSIARELVVSLNTVRTHTKHVYSKLGVNSRRAAVSRAHQLGLLGRGSRAGRS
ncbi:LuxR C-terminal-related transcriptional regulator [Nocardioides sp. YIM 152315]|uniref:LuxR C-terminal-related transcriptional regulator n=1 Tax=Nocardioides sp. YIM 152315 TaxID=3031760 RepID=UPI0023DAB7A8|nr:LuxR C-terminal-related transcriptional regulator [Nocardioides sp. YIM 152315]MDF1602731.1 LuxR C-terminal-related transcriptional regulator [Nocardioides sp. YIM 152315]